MSNNLKISSCPSLSTLLYIPQQVGKYIGKTIAFIPFFPQLFSSADFFSKKKIKQMPSAPPLSIFSALPKPKYIQGVFSSETFPEKKEVSIPSLSLFHREPPLRYVDRPDLLVPYIPPYTPLPTPSIQPVVTEKKEDEDWVEVSARDFQQVPTQTQTPPQPKTILLLPGTYSGDRAVEQLQEIFRVTFDARIAAIFIKNLLPSHLIERFTFGVNGEFTILFKGDYQCNTITVEGMTDPKKLWGTLYLKKEMKGIIDARARMFSIGEDNLTFCMMGATIPAVGLRVLDDTTLPPERRTVFVAKMPGQPYYAIIEMFISDKAPVKDGFIYAPTMLSPSLRSAPSWKLDWLPQKSGWLW